MSGAAIDSARLYRSIRELARIGAYDDEVAGVRGVRRVALTDEDAEGRRKVVEWMKGAGLEVAIDRIGNVYGLRPGRDPSLAPVLIGSHIDSVPTAGAFDGCLGVLGGLEIARTLDDRDVATRRSLAVGFFTDEEGCRFRTDMLGSAVATGRVELEEAYAKTDRDGRSVREELERISFLGDAPVDAMRPHAYLECHIEQGPVLILNGLDIGVVTGVQGISWYDVTIRGRSAHAGTTPIEYRRDAGLAAARINLHLREMIASGRYGDLRATMGVHVPHPGATNVIPGRYETTIDLRNPDDAAMARAEEDLLEFFRRREREDGVEIAWKNTARTPFVPFDPDLQDRIEGAAEARGLKSMRLLSGAGHDAQEWARICPAAMVFVPGEREGISHNPLEFSTEEQCANGVQILFDVALALLEPA